MNKNIHLISDGINVEGFLSQGDLTNAGILIKIERIIDSKPTRNHLEVGTILFISAANQYTFTIID